MDYRSQTKYDWRSCLKGQIAGVLSKALSIVLGLGDHVASSSAGKGHPAAWNSIDALQFYFWEDVSSATETVSERQSVRALSRASLAARGSRDLMALSNGR